MTLFYILDENDTPVPCEDHVEWGLWMAENLPDPVITFVGSIEITTDFVGTDMMSGTEGHTTPQVYYTKIYGGLLNGYEIWSPNKEQAEAAHAQAVSECKQAMAEHLIDVGITPDF